MINIDCQCGEKYFADDQHIGHRIKCQKCGRILTIGFSDSLTNPQPSIDPKPEPQVSRHYSRPIDRQAGLSGGQLVAIIAVSIFVILGFIVAITRFGSQTENQTTSTPSVTHQTPNQDAPTSPSETYSDSHRPPEPRPTVKPSTSALARKPRQRLHAEDQAEYEPSNPNVLPLGTAPFSYDVREGNSTLKVDNGTSTDALVRVIRVSYGHEMIRNFFIPAGQKFSAPQIPEGTYVLRVAFGKDWNDNTRRFNYRQSFSETQRFEITERRWNEPVVDGYIEHTEASDMSITLHKVPYGNFSSHPITEKEFWQ